ncbi:hypothetical protein [Siccirubricoccus soli]|nr:hypothetical protein [Siccirubricoccus soli]
MTTPCDTKPQRPRLAERLLPWVEAVYKLILATSALLAIWRALH